MSLQCCSTPLANRFALENDLIRSDIVESSEFPELAAQYRVYGVPKTVINGLASIEGALPEDFFLGAVLKAVAPADPERPYISGMGQPFRTRYGVDT